MKKKILVIGHSGEYTRIYLQFKNHFKLKFLSRKKIDALIDYKNYYKEIIKFNPEIVINCIAITGIKYCENHIDDAYFINAELPNLLSNYCHKIDAKFIHFSTDAVFEGKFLRKNTKIQNQTQLRFMVKAKEWPKFRYQNVKIQ